MERRHRLRQQRGSRARLRVLGANPLRDTHRTAPFGLHEDGKGTARDPRDGRDASDCMGRRLENPARVHLRRFSNLEGEMSAGDAYLWDEGGGVNGEAGWGWGEG